MFNPPWSSNVRTNVGAKFISLVKKHFPKSSPLYPIFNTKKLKVSYKTTSNMSLVIKSHNKKVLSGAVWWRMLGKAATVEEESQPAQCVEAALISQ